MSVELIINGESRGTFPASGTVGEFVRSRASAAGLKSFSVYVNGSKFFTEQASEPLRAGSRVELVAKDSRGSGTWGRSTNWEDEQEYPATPTSSRPYAGQKAGAMKLTFKVADLIKTAQAVLDKDKASFDEATAKYASDLSTFKSFVESQRAQIAKQQGIKNPTDVTDETIESYAQTVARSFGVSLRKPVLFVNAQAKAIVDTLSLVQGDTIEVEEGHPFLSCIGVN